MRVSKDQLFTDMATLVSTRGTCPRRKVGAIFTNKRGHVIATGYNGNAAGLPHCIEVPCEGADLPSGTGLSKCQAVHAEANALLQCKDVYEIHTAYVTASPCVDCTKLLLNTSCERIVFIENYPHYEAQHMWEEAGRKWEKHISDEQREINRKKWEDSDDIPF